MSGKSSPTVERTIIRLLRDGPMLQTDISDRFSLYEYMTVRKTLHDMARRSVVHREKYGCTYRVRLPGSGGLAR